MSFRDQVRDQLNDEWELGTDRAKLSEWSRRDLRSYQPRLTALVDLIGFSAIVRRMKTAEEEKESVGCNEMFSHGSS